jgi:hypothetical protein
MKKAYGLVALPATLMTVNIAAAAPTGIKNVVLVHGAFADGSGWDAVAVDL